MRGAEMAFLHDVDSSLAAYRLAAAAPHSYATFNSKIQNPCWITPSDCAAEDGEVLFTYLICGNNQGIPEDLQRHMINKTTEVGGAKWKVWEV